MIESQIPENAELTTWLSWFLPLGMLQRNPTLKAEMADIEAYSFRDVARADGAAGDERRSGEGRAAG